jgi:hypothetical protein
MVSKITWLMLLFCLVLPNVVVAQETTDFLVVLDVPGGGAEDLITELKKIEDIRVEGQTWFLKEVQDRGIAPRRILRRPKDLRWVMRGATIRYLIFLEKSEGGFTANFVGETGEAEESIAVAGDPLTAEGINTVVTLARKKLGKEAKPVVTAVVEDLEPEPEEVVIQPPVVEPASVSSEWLDITVGAEMLKRDLVVGGKNGGVLTYTSQLYPGGQLRVDGYPGGEDEAIGFFLRGLVGLGSVSSAGVSSGVLHIDAEAGPSYRVRNQVGKETSRRVIETRFYGGGRFTNYSTDAVVLPSTSLVALMVGGSVLIPALTDGFTVTGSVELTPFGLWLTGKEGFGTSSLTYGFGASLGGNYAFSSTMALTFDYSLRLDRTSFSGVGTLGFEGAEALELLQGLFVGLELKL